MHNKWSKSTPSCEGNYIGWYDFRTIVALHWSTTKGWRLVGKDGKAKGITLQSPKYWRRHPE